MFVAVTVLPLLSSINILLFNLLSDMTFDLEEWMSFCICCCCSYNLAFYFCYSILLTVILFLSKLLCVMFSNELVPTSGSRENTPPIPGLVQLAANLWLFTMARESILPTLTLCKLSLPSKVEWRAAYALSCSNYLGYFSPGRNAEPDFFHSCAPPAPDGLSPFLSPIMWCMM